MQIRKEQSTPLIELRTFLLGQGVDSPPWCDHTSVVSALYDLLWQQRDDDHFWIRLEQLVSKLEEQQFNISALHSSPVIPEATIETLLADLRANLTHRETTEPTWKRFVSSVGTSGLLAFLVLGTSACHDTCEDDAQKMGIDGVGNYCELVDIIMEADIAWTVRTNLLDCLPELDAEMRSEYLKDFQTSSDSELAKRLEDLSLYYYCDDEDDWNYDDGNDH
ncbi:MAG: hypothetical protein GY847_29405 [Proteobacteria bacterium]|nr:hypothetical protein [Pseudomonadota bacterium]